ncbi:metal-binding protein [Salinisphaera orenii MK-B5]|uniref:Metal-binding protein n=1 Tax=Salinisphaera orenii MK-B5 TaxID=856730 RepID=A0A423PUJ5_9GAMM|nr:DUF411 domain-containing protein [Salinisphaera orenii]ROO29263.1 metal-binding protein [Salinisphaera orenii MK-B5]
MSRFNYSRRRIVRTGFSLALAGALPVAGFARAADDAPELRVYKDPDCGCCSAWIDHLNASGFAATGENRSDMAAIKARFGVPPTLRACHTAVVDDYVVEGHVPAADIRRLLAERPRARGLAVPGMPLGSPGMEAGGRREAFRTWLLGADGATVFEEHPA